MTKSDESYACVLHANLFLVRISQYRNVRLAT